MGTLVDLSGKRFGRWTVIKRKEFDGSKNVSWLCRCDCGKEKSVLSFTLINGTSLSCGCLQKETASSKGKHYMTRTRLYKIWENMKSRCFNEKSDSFYKYGARGIKVCDEWREFEPFKDWALSHGYRDDLTIDRINNNGNYEPSNCRWTTNKEQSRNTRTNRIVIYKGEKYCLSALSELLNIPRSTLYNRLKKRNWRM